MKYLLLSDIHGCLPSLEQALRFYEEQHCDMLCILGDILNYGPRNGIPDGIDPKGIAERLNALKDNIIAVRGNCDSEVDQMLLEFPIMADYALVVDEGVRLFLTHGHIYNVEHQPTGRHDIFFYGHTHRWSLAPSPHGIVCNLGSITFPKDDNAPTFAVYEHRTVTIHSLNGDVLKQLSL